MKPGAKSWYHEQVVRIRESHTIFVILHWLSRIAAIPSFWPYILWMQSDMCHDCPRRCGVDRAHGIEGWCRLPGYEPWIASICRHTGEEPALGGTGGVANVFYTHCNLACVYCQNADISQRSLPLPDPVPVSEAVRRIEDLLARGARAVGFVSPSHQPRATAAIIDALRARGVRAPMIWNSSAYDEPSVLRAMEERIDIWLPDFKYADPALAACLSQAADYPETALRALREMYRQKGSFLDTDDDGLALSGLIVRHLVLPGEVTNSLACLDLLAQDLSPRVTVSLMAQYHPLPGMPAPLDRTLTLAEYHEVIECMHARGFVNGWLQELDSHVEHLPDFANAADPFGVE